MLYTFVNGQKKKIKTLYTFVNGQKKKIKTLYTFVNGQKKYIIRELFTLTVNPTYSGASVTFNTSGIVSGRSITVPKGTVVSYTLTADRHDTRTLTETITSNITVTPQMKLSKILPRVEYKAGLAYQVTNWLDRGQCIQGGTYTYTRGNQSNKWVVTVDSKGSITNYTTSASGGNGVTIRDPGTTNLAVTADEAPGYGWNYLDIWE